MKVILLICALVLIGHSVQGANTGVLTLGTKGTGTTTLTGVSSLYYQCRQVGTATAYTAKVASRADTAAVLYSPSGSFSASSSKSMANVVFTAISSATRAECAYIGF